MYFNTSKCAINITDVLQSRGEGREGWNGVEGEGEGYWALFNSFSIHLHKHAYTHMHTTSPDPYCILSFHNYSAKTRSMSQTLTPIWNETILIRGIRIYGDPPKVAESPPLVVIEFMDKDTLVSSFCPSRHHFAPPTTSHISCTCTYMYVPCSGSAMSCYNPLPHFLLPSIAVYLYIAHTHVLVHVHTGAHEPLKEVL